MKRYVIERDVPGVGKLSAKQLDDTREISNGALADTGPGIQWVESFVTADRIYCHYLADSEEKVHEHARRAGLPSNKVSAVNAVVDPLTATLQKV
jgi:hypothetical protein